EKVAQLEKNIGLAFYNKGHMSEALTYLDKVLEYNGVKRVKSKVVALFGLIVNLLSVLKNLYFPSKRTKRIPRKNDIEIIHLIEKRAGAFSQVDPKRFFMESIGIMRRLNNHDITKVEDGVTIYSTCSTLFSVTGISFNISRKILDYTKKYIDQKDLSTAFRYEYLELLLNICSGEWTGELGYNEALVNHRIKTGDVFYVSSYIQWNGFLSIGQGNFKGLDELLKKLDEIGKTYGHELSIGRMYAVRAKS
ncbi:hypothetical protein KA005_83085, partial [bacterium]|nr:hypothetical protein [bacterium]